MKFLFLFFLSTFISCGSPNSDTAKRCYTREEAITACQVKEIAKLGVTLDTARTLCLPYYPYENCYTL